jgi:pyruvate carboxylase
LKRIRKLLVSNRGEIAIRVFRTCSELDISTVALFTYEDRFSLHRYKADQAYQIGQAGNPVSAYLDIKSIIEIARREGVDAIHPGYGFLSERADFCRAVERAGMRFIGPQVATLEIAGNKVSTRALAQRLRVPTLPGSERCDSLQQAQQIAKRLGYPLMIKAACGGGGRGMRIAKDAASLEEGLRAAREEAAAAFDRAEVYIEKYLPAARHIEVQLLGDGTGKVLHLFERDCSIQRRHQKVVEVAPAARLSPRARQRLYDYALRLGKALKLKAAATVEFLLSERDEVFFIEINPRIQVEHTVTEEITGIDIVQQQIQLCEGQTLKLLGLTQRKIACQGVAIQCRLTTEDPENGFAPDTGKLLTYRSASGFGIRLDAGSAFTGAVISPFYDSLLVKVTAHGRDLTDASRKLRRSLQEFRIRGVKTNLLFLTNVLAHPKFLAARATTTFIDEHPELLKTEARQDRANRLLRFLADHSVNGHELMPALQRPASMLTHEQARALLPQSSKRPPPGWRSLWKELGTKRFLQRVRSEKSLLLCDTSMRDAHQSLLATRLRSFDMLAAAPAISRQLPQLFSLELWGGATFDVAMRFLKEDPWERLRLLRKEIPNILFQMLIRGANVVGYKNYPANVVRAFIAEAAQQGIDIFRIFDCFNSLDQMRVAIDAVKESGALAEVCICYTGDLLTPGEKYNLSYYRKLATQAAAAGADLLAIKDMAGLLRPYAAEVLVAELRDCIEIPLHLHTHDTAGGQVATYLKAAEAGVDVVDCAISSLAGTTSQPSMEAVVAALEHRPRATGLSLPTLVPFASYWEAVRVMYQPFESDLKSPTGEVYLNEIPGGQYSNFRPQAQSVGLGERWAELKQCYAEIDRMLGRVIKVTPSSKAIGDLAIFLLSNNLSVQQFVERADSLNLPASVLELFQGDLGQPEGGFPKALLSKILGNKDLKPKAAIPEVDMQRARIEASAVLARPASHADTLSYVLYPQVFKEFARAQTAYGEVAKLPTAVFFYGLEFGEEIHVDLERGKRLYLSMQSRSDGNAQGERTVFFELNGQTRSLVVRDLKLAGVAETRERADPLQVGQIAAPLSGALVAMEVQPGQSVNAGDRLCVIEAMKMQTIVKAPTTGVVARVAASAGSRVHAGDLLLEITQ